MFASALFAQAVRVPFVGCESFGQAGEVPAPKGVEKAVRVKASAAQRLAYYKAGGPGVLAPRGWHCAGFYGSSGAELYVTPDLFNGTRAFSRDGGITGPAIQADYITTENGSGRFDAAQVLARVFPEQKAFVKSVMESLDRPSGLTFGPYPSDKLIVKTRRFVEYQTAPHSEGLGTLTWFRANDDPIDGVAIWEEPKPHLLPDLLMLRVRLSREQRDLAPVIIQELLLRQRGDTR